MASFQDIMDAALNAEKAGDADAARTLVQEAARLAGAPDPQSMAGTITPRVGSDAEMAAEAAQRKPHQDTFGPTIQAATEQPIATTKAIAAGMVDPSKSVTGAYLPEGMGEGLKRRLSFMGDAALTGVSALGTGIAAGAGLAGEVFGGSPTNEKKLARDLLMASQVAVPELAGVSSTALIAGNAAKAARNMPQPKSAVQEAARAAEDLGIQPSLGMSGKTGAMISAGLEKTPVTGKIIADDAARAVGEIEGAFYRATQKIGPGKSAERAGDVLQDGLSTFVTRVKAKAGELFGKVGEKIPAETMIQTPETVASIRYALAPFASNPEIAATLGLDKWAGMADALEKGLSWQAASALRSQIGESIGKLNGPLVNMDGGRLKQAYGKLTADLESAAKAAGAGAEWARAQSYYKAQARRIEKQLDKLITAQTPERAFEMFDAATKGDRSTSDLNRLRAVRQSLKPEEWSTISASLVERLGKATSGTQNAAGDAFSPSTFLTNWNKLSPEAKRLVLPEDARIELQKLAQVAEAAKRANAERNFSNTSNPIGQFLLGGAFISAPITTTAAASALYLSAKGMTSTVFLRALNKAARGDAKQMRALAGGRGPFAQDAATVLRLMATEAAVGDTANSNTRPAISAAQ